MKKRSPDELFSWLDKEYAWRLKEIADLKEMIESCVDEAKNALLRAFIPILYAHWEGFIKISSESLLEHISQRELPYKQLTSNFIVYGIKSQFEDYKNAGNFQKSVQLADFFIHELNDNCSISKQLIKTNSNLSGEVFEQIATSLGIDPSPYQTRYIFLNIRLVKKRNEIAHGQRVSVELDEVDELTKGVLDLMARFKSDVQTVVTEKRYLAGTAAVAENPALNA